MHKPDSTYLIRIDRGDATVSGTEVVLSYRHLSLDFIVLGWWCVCVCGGGEGGGLR